ncbi:MAG TPA: hypothetical protein VMS55_03075 [Myxococcota bacterium]|nr:hypothetical protein [Myxococcota bacterium]
MDYCARLESIAQDGDAARVAGVTFEPQLLLRVRFNDHSSDARGRLNLQDLLDEFNDWDSRIVAAPIGLARLVRSRGTRFFKSGGA